METNTTQFGSILKQIIDYSIKNNVNIIEKKRRGCGLMYIMQITDLKEYLKSKNLFDEDVV